MSLAKATEQLSRTLDKLESRTMPTPKPRLDQRQARTDLTTREAAKLLGGTIGALCQMSDPQTVRTALKWWAEASDEVFERFAEPLEPTNLG
jgi:hypothetical protein